VSLCWSANPPPTPTSVPTAFTLHQHRPDATHPFALFPIPLIRGPLSNHESASHRNATQRHRFSRAVPVGRRKETAVPIYPNVNHRSQTSGQRFSNSPVPGFPLLRPPPPIRPFSSVTIQIIRRDELLPGAFSVSKWVLCTIRGPSTIASTASSTIHKGAKSPEERTEDLIILKEGTHREN
jgi:hypothetical protein